MHALFRPFTAVISFRSLFGFFLIAGSAMPVAAAPITLDAAIDRAAAAHPDLAIANAEVATVQGHRLTAETRPYNPELSFSATSTRVAGASFVDYQASVGQVFELGDKRSRRVAAATAALAASRWRLDWTRREVVLRVRRTYYIAALARALVDTAKDAQVAAEEAKAATEERLKQKAGTQLEVNVASADAGRAKRIRLDAERAYTVALAELGTAIGARPSEDLEPTDDPGPPPELMMTEDALVTGALSSRADLRAIRSDLDSASATVALADAQRVPDVGVNIGYSRERDPDLTFHRFTVGISIPLPLFDRKQGDRAAARGELRKAATEEQASRWQAERDIRTAYRGYLKAREAVRAFDLDVVGRLDENLKLAKDSFQTGKIGLLEFNVVRRELVETRIAYLEARRESVEALIAVELAAGDVEVIR